MAKKKDITRNPPSWLEKGIFVVIIAILVGIAFPVFWKLNESTRELYTCYSVWEPMIECLNEWKAEGNTGRITEEEMLARYTAKTGNTSLPTCPYDEKISLFGKRAGTVGCSAHGYIVGLGQEVKEDKK